MKLLITFCVLVTFSDLNISSYSIWILLSTSKLKEIIIGRISTIWAIIIIEGVYKIWKNPKGPEFENKIYNTNPTKTGGNPIKEFIKSKIIFFILKFVTEHIAAKGKPIKPEIVRAVKETFNDKITISNKSESKENINFKELKKISVKSCTKIHS